MRAIMRKWGGWPSWLLLLSGVSPAMASKYNMPVGVTPISQEIYTLHMTIFWIVVAIGVVVFSVLIYSLINHRKSQGAVAAKFHSSLSVELAWTLIPFVILVLMAIPATRVLLMMEDDSNADLNIKITGYQWKWKYDYLDENISFFSTLSTTQDQIEGRAPKGEHYLLEVDKPIVVPTHKKIRFLVTANDVIHSWWVPELGVKRDAIPGFIHEAWAKIDKPGTYRGQCAELCGVGHGFMPIVVVAKDEADYKKWVAEQKGVALKQANLPEENKAMTKAELMDAGQKVYNATCTVCHQAAGTGMPPAFPALKGSKIVTGEVSKQLTILLHGIKGTAMQAFGEQLSDKDIASVVTFARNSWGNDDQAKFGKLAGGTVQPSAVAAARKVAQ
jgi:cytochrome c oxidase subunit 2